MAACHFDGYIKRHIYRREGCTSWVRGTHVATFWKHQSKLASSNLIKKTEEEASILGCSFTFSCSTHRVLVDKSCCPAFYAPPRPLTQTHTQTHIVKDFLCEICNVHIRTSSDQHQKKATAKDVCCTCCKKRIFMLTSVPVW